MRELEELKGLCKEFDDIKQRQIEAATALMKEYGITKLGLWDNEDGPKWREQDCRYNEEDEALFGNLAPQFSNDISYGGTPGEDCRGRIFAIEINDGLKLKGFNSWTEKSFLMEPKWATIEDNNVFFNDVMKALIDTIEFNLTNNIPVEKWGIAHCPWVDPYTWEYLIEKTDE